MAITMSDSLQQNDITISDPAGSSRRVSTLARGGRASLMGGPAHRLATNLTEMGGRLWPELCLPRADVEDALGVGWVRRVAPTPPSSPLSAQYKCAPSCTRLVGDFERKWWTDRGAHRLSAPSVNALAVANSSVHLPAMEARGAVRMCEEAPLTVAP